MEVEFTERIKSVFDVCDFEGNGYITINHLKALAKDHFGADSEEETICIIQLLDPEGKGKVSFNDFCQGVQQILEVQAISKQATSANLGNRTNFLKSFHLSEVSPQVVQDTSWASECTFNKNYTNTDEDGAQHIDITAPASSIHLCSSHGQGSGRSSVTSKTDEENYEESRIVDLESDSSDANLSPSRRLANAIIASHLARGVRSPNGDIYDDIDCSFQEITDRVKSLENQINKVTNEMSKEDAVKPHYKDESNVLIQRIHTMEEQLKDMEVKSEEKLRGEKIKIQMKQNHDNEKMDYLTQRLQMFEIENEKLKSDVSRLKTENDRLKMDKLQIADRLMVMEDDYSNISLEYNQVMAKFDQEQLMTGTLLEEMQMELEDLRRYKIDCERRHPHENRTPCLSDFNGFNPFQTEMQKLKEANLHLKEENDELNAQLLAQAVNMGKYMLQEGNSLAEELEHMTKEELMTSLREQQDVNFRLKQYVDKMLTIILEKNPSLLEIGH